MKIKFLILLMPLYFSMYSQDSTMAKHDHGSKVKLLNHEIGFNTVSLIKQLVSNNPSSTLPQLPYAVVYNLYYKNSVGIRVGVGLTTGNTETYISGQTDRRVTKSNSQDVRLGISYNFIKSRRFTANVFGDYIYTHNNLYSTNTSTTQTFPNPISTLTVESNDNTVGNGGEVGVGLKYTIIKHLSIYAEVPLVFLARQTSSTTSINDSGNLSLTISSVKNSSSQIILPTTIYLVLTF